jgi:hypothetical protein
MSTGYYVLQLTTTVASLKITKVCGESGASHTFDFQLQGQN